MSANALNVLQDLLDRQAKAILAGDTQMIAGTMTLPYRRTYINMQTLIETEAELQRDFTPLQRFLRSNGVSNYLRIGTYAEYLGKDYLLGFYDSHMLQGSNRVADFAQNRIVLHKHKKQDWAAIEIEHPFELHDASLGRHGNHRGSERTFASARSDVRRSDADALTVYQGYLDETARTVAEGDFAAYAALHHFPYTAHGSKLDNTIYSPDDLRPFYNALRRCHDGEIGDRILRVAERAEFIGPDLLCGYHSGKVFKGEVQTVDTVHSRLILKRDGTDWKLQSVTNSIHNKTYPFSMYIPGGVLRTHQEIQKRIKQ